MARDTVVAYLHPEEVAYSFHKSLIDLIMHDSATGDGHLNGVVISVEPDTNGLVEARNEVIRGFLAGDGEWLLWIDADMGFQPDALARLHAVANADTAPIVAGLCFGHKVTGEDGYNGKRKVPWPTLLLWNEDQSAFNALLTYPINAVVPVGATGSAFILIHRSVLEAVGSDWYTRIANPQQGGSFGEDISFCIRANAAGARIFVHTGVRTTHLKRTWLREDDFWQMVTPDPATDETAVIVPVVGRPQNAEPFMRSLRASTGLATAYAIVEEDDPASLIAWTEAGAVVLTDPQARTFAEKVNVGYQRTREPWLFLVGDDVRFHPGWLDHAQHIARIERAAVIGTNDMGNPRVMRGEHATHMLIARSYIDEHGASWDGPGVVCHEGYGHWYVDDELVTAAKERGVWAMALGSIVEHMHPLWQKGSIDDTYRKGQAKAAADKALWQRRLANHQAVTV